VCVTPGTFPFLTYMILQNSFHLFSSTTDETEPNGHSNGREWSNMDGNKVSPLEGFFFFGNGSEMSSFFGEFVNFRMSCPFFRPLSFFPRSKPVSNFRLRFLHFRPATSSPLERVRMNEWFRHRKSEKSMITFEKKSKIKIL